MRPDRGGTAGPAPEPPGAAPDRHEACARPPGPLAPGPRHGPPPAAGLPPPPATVPTRVPLTPARRPSGHWNDAHGTGATRTVAPSRCRSAADPARRNSETA